jgi:hypothetical protein
VNTRWKRLPTSVGCSGSLRLRGVYLGAEGTRLRRATSRVERREVAHLLALDPEEHPPRDQTHSGKFHGTSAEGHCHALHLVRLQQGRRAGGGSGDRPADRRRPSVRSVAARGTQAASSAPENRIPPHGSNGSGYAPTRPPYLNEASRTGSPVALPPAECPLRSSAGSRSPAFGRRVSDPRLTPSQSRRVGTSPAPSQSAVRSRRRGRPSGCRFRRT